MGFFSELKEDLSQAVNELLPDENNAGDSTIPNDAEGLEKLLEQMDADELLGDALEELPNENREEPKIEAGSYFASVLETSDTPVQEDSLKETIPEMSAAEEPVEKQISKEASEEIAASDAKEQKAGLDGTTEITAESKEAADFKQSENDAKHEIAMEELKESEGETKNMRMETESLENEKAVEETVETVESADENNKDNGGLKMDSQLANKQAVDETAVITAGMTIQGDIISEGSMEVIGSIIGNIDILGKLNITGVVQGNSKAAEIYCENAKITGEIASEGSVKIGQSTVIIGNISANSAVIAGAVKGDIDVHGPVVLDTSAIVMGNIKSKSVQINNGAVIEGMCSQCYADVSPSSFFEDFKAMTKKGNK